MTSTSSSPHVQQMLFDKIRRAMRQGETSWTDWWKETIQKNNLINYASIHTGLTLLHVAARWGRLNEVDYLLSQGARVDVQDLLGHTPLWLAAWQGHTESVEKLLEAGATIEKQSLLIGDTPLQIAKKRGHQQTADILSRKRDRNGAVISGRLCQLDPTNLQQKIEELTRTKRQKVDLQEQYHTQQMINAQQNQDMQPLAYHLNTPLPPPATVHLATPTMHMSSALYADRIPNVPGIEDFMNTTEDIFNPSIKSNTLFL